MSRKSVLLMTLTAMLIGTFGVAFRAQRAKAGGTIYIRADGSVEGTTNIVTADNITYTFTDNIHDEIVVERSNIIIDGAGHTVNGPGTGLGFNLTNINNATIKNTQIKQFNHGICLLDSSNNTVSGNNITNNMFGVYLGYSSNSTVSGNNITSNYDDGVYLLGSSDNTVSGNNITNNDDDGVYLYSFSDNNTVSENNITNNDYGIHLYHFSNNNTVSENKLTNNYDGVHLMFSSDNTVSENNITNNSFGIELYHFSDNNTVSENNITNNDYGIHLYSSSDNNTVSENNITNNDGGVYVMGSSDNAVSRNNITNNYDDGVYLLLSSNNIVSGNNITNNYDGVHLILSSDNNTVSENNITNNSFGAHLLNCSNNRFYHNNLINNTEQVYVTPGHANFWDNGLEGNYWSDYVEFDLDLNGIGDSAYEIPADNIDNYPMMGTFSDFSATSEYHVQTVCNSSISDFQYNGTAICFNVTGENGTTGFCRICIPRTLMNETYKVFVNGTEVPCNLLPCSNSTHSYLYFGYEHSTQEVVIVSEFPLTLLLPLFIMATLLTVTLYKRKNSRLSIATARRFNPIHHGFEYIAEMDGLKLFKKRK